MIIQAICDQCGKPACTRDHDSIDYCQRCWIRQQLIRLYKDRDSKIGRKIELDASIASTNKQIERLEQRLNELGKLT